MTRNIQCFFLMIIIFMTVSVQFLCVQETESFPEQGKYDLIVDSALDQVEENIDRGQDDEAFKEPMTMEEATIEADIEVLEDIVVDSNGELKEVLETKMIPLLHAEASGIVDALNEMKSSAGEVLYNAEDSALILKDVPEHLKTMSAYVKEVDIVLETETFKLEYVKGRDVFENIEDILTKNVGKIQLDEPSNSIVVTDTPMTIGKIRKTVESLDFVDKDIQIETKILQIVLNDEHTMGVDWEAIVSDFQDIDFAGFLFEANSENKKKLNVGAISQEDYEILLEALDMVGVVHDVSSGTIKTKNKDTKTINIFSSLFRDRKKSKSNLAGETNINPKEKIQFHVTPILGGDAKIKILIRPEHIDKNTGRLPQPQNLNATIQVESGETIVIGSLFEEVFIESKWKVPVLGDIPLLGLVFRNQGEESRKAEVVTFLTVQTIKKDSEVK